MPDLLTDIFGGGESDLSDAESDHGQAPPKVQPTTYRQETPSEGTPEPEEGDGDGDGDGGGGDGDDDYAQPSAGAAPAEVGADEDGAGQGGSALPKIKKLVKKRPEGEEVRKKKPKKKAPAEGEMPPDEDDAPLNPEEQRRQDLYARIDLAAKGGKKTKKRKRRDGDDDLDAMADEEVAQLRSNMMLAATQDQEANEERRPATAKIIMLPTVVTTMQKSHLESSILENNILDAVRKWLEPLSDKSLPALNIQRSLFQLLIKMPNIDDQALRSSDLGKIVLFYTKCKRVEPTIKRMADTLVMTWMRPIIRSSANYRNRPATAVNLDTQNRVPLRASAPSGSQSANASGATRARIPETIHQVYSIAPASNANAGDERDGRVGTQKATAKKSREWVKRMQEAKKVERRGV